MKTRNSIRLGNYADILTDRTFKRSFGSERWKRLTELLLQLLIPEHQIESISFSPTEHVNSFDGSKDIRVDVECTDVDGTRFMVEMQLAKQKNFYERAIFNSSFGVQEQIAFGRRDYLYKPVYFIGIMSFGPHRDSDRVLYRYKIREDESGEVMSENLQYIFLELPNAVKTAGEATSVMERVFYSMLNMSGMESIPAGWDDDEIIKLLFDSVKISKFTAEERTNYIEDMTTKQDIDNAIDYATELGHAKGLAEGREKGLVEGREKGLLEGRQKGLAEGREKGLAEGRRQERDAIAARMRSQGIDEELIAKVLEP